MNKNSLLCHIVQLGNQMHTQKELLADAVVYFITLYRGRHRPRREEQLQLRWLPRLVSDETNMLMARMSLDEDVKSVFFSLKQDKTSEPNKFKAKLYCKNWYVIRVDIIFLDCESTPKEANTPNANQHQRKQILL